MNAGKVRRMLTRYLDPHRNLVVPEFSLDGSYTDRADMISISPSGYATEYEIKVSTDDWREDARKVKWAVDPSTGNALVSRFFYVVPGRRNVSLGSVRFESAIAIPGNLRPGTGLIVVTSHGCHQVTAARRWKVKPVPPAVYDRARDAYYHRYWRALAEIESLREEVNDLARRLREKRAAA